MRVPTYIRYKGAEEKRTGPQSECRMRGRCPRTCKPAYDGACQVKRVHVIQYCQHQTFIAPSPNKLLYSRSFETHTLTGTSVSLRPIFGFVHYLMTLSAAPPSDSSATLAALRCTRVQIDSGLVAFCWITTLARSRMIYCICLGRGPSLLTVVVWAFFNRGNFSSTSTLSWEIGSVSH